MYSIVVVQHNKVFVIGIRTEGIYEDSRNLKAYIPITKAKEVFEDKAKVIQREEK